MIHTVNLFCAYATLLLCLLRICMVLLYIWFACLFGLDILLCLLLSALTTGKVPGKLKLFWIWSNCKTLLSKWSQHRDFSISHFSISCVSTFALYLTLFFSFSFSEVQRSHISQIFSKQASTLGRVSDACKILIMHIMNIFINT